MSTVEVTRRQRHSGILSVRHSVARVRHDCIECGQPIRPSQTYWRRYGRMGEVFHPFTAYTCEVCEVGGERGTAPMSRDALSRLVFAAQARAPHRSSVFASHRPRDTFAQWMIAYCAVQALTHVGTSMPR